MTWNSQRSACFCCLSVGIKDTCHFSSTQIQWILPFHRCENRGSCLRHKQKSSLQLILQAFRERFCPLAKSRPLQVWKQHTEAGFVQQRRPLCRSINNGPGHDFSKDEHSWLFFFSHVKPMFWCFMFGRDQTRLKRMFTLYHAHKVVTGLCKTRA